MTANEGAAVDEAGETEDWIELINAGTEPLRLGNFRLGDDMNVDVPLPDLELAAGAAVVLWADDDPEQGDLHLPFKLSAAGDALYLFTEGCERVDTVTIPPLPDNESFARLPDGAGDFAQCRYATPKRLNGTECSPPEPPSLPEDVVFTPYPWPEPWPAVQGPLVLSELALRPASFVEVMNTGEAAITLSEYVLRVSPHGPGVPWPAIGDGIELAWPVATLGPGERVLVPVTESDVAAIAAVEAYEGVVTVFRADSGAATERVDFMRWPDGAALTRIPDRDGRHRFCSETTPGAANDSCAPLASRDVGDRIRHLRTPGDFAALAAGEGTLGAQSVKFVVDMESGDVVHLLAAERWALHYTFIREQIYLEPPLDRCDEAQSREFDIGWGVFSQKEYFSVDSRRFLLGTLEHHGSTDLHTVEFALGDAIIADQARHAFFTVMEHVDDPTIWALRPQSGEQLAMLEALDGLAPIVGPNAPFIGMTFQALTEAVGYGVLRFVPEAELEQTPLGHDVIVVTDDVPNDIPLVGGLITEAFQTPLAHVNVLSQARQTPNMALVQARTDPRLGPFFDKLVRLEVTGGTFSIREADPAEAEAFWQSRLPSGPPAIPRLDTSQRALQPLSEVGMEAVPFIGVKASQLAELTRLSSDATCSGVPAFQVPASAFAVPVVHYIEHFERSGASSRLVELRALPGFRADPSVRAAGLEEIRQLMLDTPVDEALLADVTEAIQTRFGSARVRMRSSSNAEDLPTFNGAGLYTSVSAAVGDPERPVADGLRTVWASLWNARAYDERELANIEHSACAMGVMIHEAFLSEKAQGVAISRNILDPVRGDIYYINAQIGEASVTNPAPGVVTEQLIYRLPPRTPAVTYQSRSSLTDEDVLSESEIPQLACALGHMHAHFRPLLDPDGSNRLFAMETEFKLITSERKLLLKQARPHPFGNVDIPADCREF